MFFDLVAGVFAAGNHIFNALVNDFILTGIDSMQRNVNGFCARGKRESCDRSFAFS